METYYPIKLPRNSSRTLKQMRALIREEKPLMAMVIYSEASLKTRRKICKLLKVKTKAGVLAKISPKHKKHKTE